MSIPLIDSTRLEEIFRLCMFKDNEVVDGEPITPYKVGKGIMLDVGFHEGRLNKHSDEIIGMLKNLPKEFYRGSGDGMTFLNMCNDKNGEQWTGSQQTMEQLVQLGTSLDQVEFLLDRELWAGLPGGVPYVVINMEFEE